VLEDDATRGELSRRGVDQAQRASWSEVAGKYLGLYERAMGTTADPHRGLEIVVVAYGRPDLLEASLQPVLSFPVTVVDNSSSPDVATVCQRLGVRYLDPGHNGGFGAGVNHALARRLDPDADVLLLNPDAVIASEDVLLLHRALLADPALASVAPAQVDEAGHHSRVSWPFPSPGRTWLTAAGLGRLGASSGFVIGSVLLLRREALAQVGQFDDDFFLYAEETDWARRAAQLGWRHGVVPTVTARHVGAATSTDHSRRETHFHASQELYLRKHHGPAGWQAARSAQVAGSALRSVVLPSARRGDARRRLSLYLHGPRRVEAGLRPPAMAGSS
jgi:GT2 family glycosyltransferase